MILFHKSFRIFKQTIVGVTAFSVIPGMCAIAAAQAAKKPEPDVIVFKNGDQLTGTLERGVGGDVVFKSDVVGEITVSMSKVKELHSHNNFAVIRKDEKTTKIHREAGPITFVDDTVSVATKEGTTENVPAKELAFIVDQGTYDKEVAHEPGIWYGWTGSLLGGATLVRSTQEGTSFTAGITLLREIPTVPYLPKRYRTTFNLLESYGKLTQPVIPQTTPPTPTAEAKTSIFHADAEHDKYFNQRFYALVDLSYDHNFAQGLNLQQLYGAGVGWTPLETPVQQLDLKAEVHYMMQSFIQSPPPAESTPEQNLIGATFGEAYHRNLPAKIVFTESASIQPAFNNSEAYTAIAAAGLTLPAYKRFNLGLNATDNYLNLPAAGFKKNSFQFITSIVYNLK